MVEVTKYGEFKPSGKQKKKSQIILAHSSRNVHSYLLSLKYRLNGKYNKIPNYVITKDGKVLQLLKNEEHTSIFPNQNVNRNSIIIIIENLGWLQKEPLKDYYVNWIGDIYKGKVFEKKWRDYFFWDPYTEEQIISTVNLVKHLIKEMKIEPNVVGHNTKINKVERFEGIVTRSNFNSDYTDLSPAFNFEEFLKRITDEQFT
jgi:hypothetical protein